MTRRHLLLPVVAVAALAGSAICVLPASGVTPRNAIRFNRCPQVVRAHQEAKTDRNPRAVEVTVPLAPSALQLCRYYGSGLRQTPRTRARAGKLRSERILRKAGPILSIAHEFDSLQPFPEGPIYCPADEGGRLYAVFAYSDPAEPKVPVVVNLSGCRGAWNGRTERAFWMTPHLLRRLQTLTSGTS